MKDFSFRLIYFLIICFVIYENYSLNNKISELEEIIHLQNRAIKMQNLLLDYKDSKNLIETDDNGFYNPLNQNFKKLPI